MTIKSYQFNNKNYYEVYVCVYDGSGNRLQKRKRKIESLKKAQQLEFENKRELLDETNRPGKITFRNWHQKCLERMKFSYKKSTLSWYDGDLKKWLTKDFNLMFIDEITKSDVHDFIYESLPSSISENLRKTIHKKIRRLLEFAVEDGIIPRNPAIGITVKVPAPVKKVLNTKEVEKLLSTAKESDHKWYHIWAFALFSGLRSGEMYALRVSDVDLESGLIHVTKQWTSRDGTHPTKGNRNRVVPISKELRGLLFTLLQKKGYAETLFNGMTKEKVKVDDLLLPRVRTWRTGEQAQVLRDYCKVIGITEVKFHDLRATFITNLLSQGVPLVKVMSIVGHSKMATTDEYVRLAGVPVKDSTDKLSYRLPRHSDAKVISLFNNND